MDLGENMKCFLFSHKISDCQGSDNSLFINQSCDRDRQVDLADKGARHGRKEGRVLRISPTDPLPGEGLGCGQGIN